GVRPDADGYVAADAPRAEEARQRVRPRVQLAVRQPPPRADECGGAGTSVRLLLEHVVSQSRAAGVVEGTLHGVPGPPVRWPSFGSALARPGRARSIGCRITPRAVFRAPPSAPGTPPRSAPASHKPEAPARGKHSPRWRFGLVDGLRWASN